MHDEQPPRGAPWVSGLVGHFVQTWPDSELLSHSAVLRLSRLELTLQSLSPVLALYDPFGVDVPLNCDTTTTIHSTISSYTTPGIDSLSGIGKRSVARQNTSCCQKGQVWRTSHVVPLHGNMMDHHATA